MKFSVQNLIKLGNVDSVYTIFGWVRSKRGNKQITFLAVNDGSCFENIQVVSELEKDLKNINTGSSVRITGKLKESKGSGQKYELIAWFSCGVYN